MVMFVNIKLLITDGHILLINELHSIAYDRIIRSLYDEPSCFNINLYAGVSMAESPQPMTRGLYDKSNSIFYHCNFVLSFLRAQGPCA